ncbi:TetR/AcrR family transcriptional regulator [Tsuneonella dongtanensis]|nr:TetR/AcrR family transcriptional regulator [Tsuneonella dongtanensis]
MSRAEPKRRTRLDPAERRRLILDHAAEVIAQEGVSALSMERIGREAGVSKSLVYNYFPNLNELLSELLERELRRLRRMQGQAAEGAETFEGLVRAVTHVYLKYIDERGLLLERLQAEPHVSAVHDPTEYGRETAVDYLTELVMRHFELPRDIARAATDISFGLPASAGAYLHRHGMPRPVLEDLTVAMIIGSVTALKTDYMARTKPLRPEPRIRPVD